MFRVLLLLAAVATIHACKPCTCGVARRARVVGGDRTYPGEFPWLAVLRRDEKVICGATVVANDHLITAAHCVNGIDASRLSVLVGEYDVSNTVSAGFRVQQVIQHPDFNRISFDNDIAVLRLADVLPEYLVKPACLPDFENNDLVGLNAVVAGWGTTVEDEEIDSNIPLKVELKIWGEEQCSNAAYGKRKVTSRMLCAYAPGKDACRGDSGGPLLLTKPYYTMIGIVSWGRGCAKPNYPGVYTRVTSFMPWLQGALRHACTCQPPSFY